MISAITIDQAIASGASFADYRHRPTRGERTVLPDSAPPAPRNSEANGGGDFSEPDHQVPAQPEPPARDHSSMFAAAVLSGALPPTPQTMDELVRRIGISPIPEESQARLKDLLV